MGLRTLWRDAKRKAAGAALQHEAKDLNTPEEAETLLRPYVEAWNMSPKLKTLVLAVLAAILAGCAQYITTAADALAPATLQAAAVVGLTAGLIVFAAKMRTWSGSHVETSIAFVMGGTALGMAAALQKGATPKVALGAGLAGAIGAAGLLISPSPAEQGPVTVKLPPGAGPLLVLLLGVLLPPVSALADQSTEPPVRMTFGALGSFTVSEAGAKTVPGAFVRVEGPLVVGTASPLRLFAQADIMGLPGATQGPVLDQLETFSAARGSAGLLRDIGAMVAGGQDIRTAVVLHGGFATRIGSDPAPLERYARSYGVGLQFEERYSGAYLRLEIGHDDAVAPALGRGHLLVSASIPVPHSAGVAALGADAALALGHPEGVTTFDRITFFLRVSPPRATPSVDRP